MMCVWFSVKLLKEWSLIGEQKQIEQIGGRHPVKSVGVLERRHGLSPSISILF